MPTAYNSGQRQAGPAGGAMQVGPAAGGPGPQSEMDQFLYGPPQPYEQQPGQTGNIMAGVGGSKQPPPEVYDAAPTIIAAAREPGAPAALQALAAHLTQLLGS